MLRILPMLRKKGDVKKLMGTCETCAYYAYDEEWEEYYCQVQMDEDEYVRLLEGHYKQCPYYRDGDEYKIAAKQ